MKVPVVTRFSAAWIALALLTEACSLVPAARTNPAKAPHVAGAPTAGVADGVKSTSSSVADRQSAATKRERPPDGLLRSGSESVTGQLGSFCYGKTCADIGRWPPKSELPELVAQTKSLEFTLGNGEPFVGWTASYNQTADDDRSRRLGQGGGSFDADANPAPADQFSDISFDAPPAGDWVVWMFVQLESGDLSYAWHVTVLPDTATGG